jgi:hypothetical protein
MAVVEGLVTGVLVKGIYANRVLFDDSAGEIESGILIPARSSIEVSVETQQDCATEQLQLVTAYKGGQSDLHGGVHLGDDIHQSRPSYPC